MRQLAHQRALLLILLLVALLSTLLHTSATATNDTDSDQPTLAQVSTLLSQPGTLHVQQAADGHHFVDLHGQQLFVLLARSDARGQLVIRCVGSTEEALAFLSSAQPTGELAEPGAFAPANPTDHAFLSLPSALASHTTISVLVRDGPNEGFNDSTPATPVGGNAGTTIGAQRLIAFQYALNIWASTIQSNVPIKIDARFDALGCTILGAAGPQTFHSDFISIAPYPGPAYPQTWYAEALANKRAGYDLSPSSSEISATFNSDLDSSGCTGGSWYYGLDGQEPTGSADLVSVLLHEIGHGLGFLSLIGVGTDTYGRNFPYAADPAQNQDDVWNHFLYHTRSNRLFATMSVAERAAAITDTHHLAWNGPGVTVAAQHYLIATPVLTITSPLALGGQYDVSTATFGSALPTPPLVGTLVAAIDPDNDGAGSADTPFDACSPLSNAAAVAGAIVLIDRGTCTFTLKARYAQQAGAIGVVIANQQSGGPPALGGSDATIQIPVVAISQADGVTLRTALPLGAQIGRDRSRQAGADSAGRLLLYAPNPFEAGSSLSHFDISAAPNLLMEPGLNSDVDQSLDLTDELLRDIGWYPDQNYDGIPDDLTQMSITLFLPLVAR